MIARHYIGDPEKFGDVWRSECTCGIAVYGRTQAELHVRENEHLDDRLFAAQWNAGSLHRKEVTP